MKRKNIYLMFHIVEVFDILIASKHSKSVNVW